MEKKYYIHDRVTQKGPFTLNELEQMELNSNTLIWYLGLEEWITLDKLPELHHLIKRIVPPNLGVKRGSELQSYSLPIVEYDSSNTSRRNKRQSYGNPIDITSEPVAKVKTTSNKNYIRTIVLSLIGLVMFALFLIVTNEDSYQEKLLTLKDIENSDPLNFLETEGNYSENFWETKINIEGQIRNKASVANYKDVVIRVVFYTKTKTVITTEDYMIYEFILANGTKEFNLKVPNYDNTESVSCKIVGAKTYQ
jgi:hypothetical protein